VFQGHGPALAQAYNHIILPLANTRDKTTQVIWGLRDFQRRFGRRAEGMWLPETAVDLETLEILAGQGLRFTILAPHQAARVRRIGQESWRDVSGGNIDPRRPYLCRLPSGRDIALFFYHGPLAHGVAFGDLLKKGDLLAERISSAFAPECEEPQLVHLATDGETFGHHHRFGEMALSFGLKKLAEKHDVRITVYAEFLKEFPPDWEVEIREHTSWSCPHGVERWRGHCGCSGGSRAGWSQDWRAPLRQAMDWLRDHLAPLYEKTVREVAAEPWELRNAYIDVVLDRSEHSVNAFFKNQGLGALHPGERIRILKALEMQRAANLMYTSCGWFFDDISRIESLQVLAYAARALQLAADLGEGGLEQEYRLRLQQARSNDPAARDGAHLYGAKITPLAVDLDKVAAQVAMSSLFLEYPRDFRIGSYEILRRGWERRERGPNRMSTGTIGIRSMSTGESRSTRFASLYRGGLDVTAWLSGPPDSLPEAPHAESLMEAFERGDMTSLAGLLDRDWGPRRHTFSDMLKDGKRETLDRMFFGSDIDLETLLKAAQAMRSRGIPVDRLPLTSTLEKLIHSVLSALSETPSDLGLLNRALCLHKIGRDLGLEPDLGKSRALYFGIVRNRGEKARREESEGRHRETAAWRGRLSALGRALRVRHP
jgi:hypothetical protein